MNFGEWQARLEYRVELIGWLLYLYKDEYGTGRRFLKADGTTELVKPNGAVKNEMYFAHFEDESQLRAISNAFADKGIKTTNDHKNEGLLEATKAHLEDMRTLVFAPVVAGELHPTKQEDNGGSTT